MKNLERRHAIIIIKNDKNEYLQYYDDRWNGNLFLNCKLKDEFDIEKIREEVSKVLGTKDIKVNFVWDVIHSKFSESAKIYKTYHHYFFTVNTLVLPDIMNNKEFVINDIKYRWFSMNELENDKRIQEINSDIVGYIKQNNL